MFSREILGDCGRAAIQIQGSTSNPFGSTFMYGYPNAAFEVNRHEEWLHCNSNTFPVVMLDNVLAISRTRRVCTVKWWEICTAQPMVQSVGTCTEAELLQFVKMLLPRYLHGCQFPAINLVRFHTQESVPPEDLADEKINRTIKK
ncbi:hypothetical protein OROGR_017342 [Orobanche gracilis]